MSKRKLSIEVDVPDGYELTGEYRHCEPGEYYLSCLGEEVVSVHGSVGMYPILRKVWQPPKWLPDGCWIFYTSNGGWRVSREEPTPSQVYDGEYLVGNSVRFRALEEIFGEYPPPPVNKIQV